MAGPGAVVTTFGLMPDGREVPAITLINRHGVRACVIAYGATLQALLAPDRDGVLADIALGHADLDGYLETRQLLGATAGRVVNRIAGGRFVLDGVPYQLSTNDGEHLLHGGDVGFDRVLWDVVALDDGGSPAVTLRYVSPDGDQGFPGAVTATATYRLDDANALTVEYRATTDRPTIVNMTNHAYWNLAGEAAGSVGGHRLTIPAERYLPVDDRFLPTGEKRAVAGTRHDFRHPRPIGAPETAGEGYDNNFIIGDAVAAEPRLMGRLEEPGSGRVLEVWSNQPGVQLYTGNFLDGSTRGKTGRMYQRGDAVSLEPQLFPDAPNRPDFPPITLAAGETYRNVIAFRFGVGN